MGPQPVPIWQWCLFWRCRYSTALVLCDQSWVDPDLDDSNGIQVRERRDMLRLESQILLVQLHIRKSLMVRACCPVHPS